MLFTALKALNFRNYSRLELAHFDEVNIITGSNGSGKTNLLEAIYLLSAGRSFRNIPLDLLCNWKEANFYLKGQFDENTVEFGYTEAKKVYKFNGKNTTPGRYRQSIPIVAFLPGDTSIITSGPSTRRGFLNSAISVTDSDYRTSLSRYTRALRQKNAQLKLSAKGADIWNEELVKWGSIVIEKRLSFTRRLCTKVSELYRELYGRELSLRYLNPFRIEGTISDSFRAALLATRKMEAIRKHTLAGPHRDNFMIHLDGRECSTFASQSQLRTLAMALKFGAVENIEESLGVRPVLLFDDVLLEMDSTRREKLLASALGRFQSFFTLVDPTTVTQYAPGTNIIRVSEGKVI